MILFIIEKMAQFPRAPGDIEKLQFKEDSLLIKLRKPSLFSHLRSWNHSLKKIDHNNIKIVAN